VSSAGNGTVTINYRAIDNVGNVEPVNSTTVRVDSINPVVNITYNVTYSDTGPDYVNASTPITLITNDNNGGSGISTLNWIINGVSNSTAGISATFTLQLNGTYNITYWSVDNVGNIGVRSTTFLRVDLEAPVTTLQMNGTNIADGSTVNISIRSPFAFTSTDGVGSGVKSIFYKINSTQNASGTGWLTWTSSFTLFDLSILDQGIYNLYWYAIDNVNNDEAISFITMNLTRLTTITNLTLVQPRYNYSNSSSPFTIYYGANTTIKVRFLDDENNPILGADFVNVSFNGFLYTGMKEEGDGYYNVSIATKIADVGENYSLIVYALKSGQNLGVLELNISILPAFVYLTILNISQPDFEVFKNVESGVWTGEHGKNLTIEIAVFHGLSNESINFGYVKVTYKRGSDVFYTKNYTDVDGDGIFVVIIPADFQHPDEDAALNFQWISTSNNYLSTPESETTIEISIRFVSKQINLIALFVIIGLIAIVGITYGVIQNKVVKPRRLQRANTLRRISSAFEDAANIQHVFIIHIISGTCLFFKSFGQETIDPDLISGFLTAVQSFGTEISGTKTSRSLEGLTYQDYKIIVGEGKYVRLALALASEASMILRSLVPEFIQLFEERYESVLQNWRGDLTLFKDASRLIDEIFDTSIILPHKKTYIASTPKSSLAKKLLDIVDDLIQERDFFFIATLLSEGIKRTKRSYMEVIAAIQELRMSGFLEAIDIEALEKGQALSQAELLDLQQKVAQIHYLSPEEQANLLESLKRMKPEEREATLSSYLLMAGFKTPEGVDSGRQMELPKGAEITSKTRVDVASITSKKEAVKTIGKMVRSAKESLKEKKYKDALVCFETAELIAREWNMKKEAESMINNKIQVLIKESQIKKAKAVEDAKMAERAGDFQTAIQKYLEASQLSSALFKLGISSEDKKTKEYNRKAERLKRLMEES
ncbi:MAG: hypothetical protein ACTSRA_07190, partial [Promethearchaeota archaeon]